MKIDTAHTDESGPARWMSQRCVVTAQQRDLGLPQRHERIPVLQQGTMERNEETPAHGVVDIPEAGHDVGYARREERPAETQRAFDTRHRSGGRTAGGENDHARQWEALTTQIMKV